ncbi:hypothetical protein [Neorhizobium sp. JUb45]|uniref:hypothetical protein n=1 Tax=unclassified Neorhizobium TaxID=2629175 RepID=UPI0010434575|nr:hypothetical protein [Neorhizobium sp. JUb45]TCR04322.1 hypothetical protein EDF70_102420 [Neorhizobium sp. JUb45]
MDGHKDIDRSMLLEAFDRLGMAAAQHGTMIDIVVYGGSALMFASNFRFATGDVDIAPLGEDKPSWFDSAVAKIAVELGFREGENWLNDAVAFHLSRLATKEADHWEYGTFPRAGEMAGLRVYVPTAEYMLALKLKAMRVLDPSKGEQEKNDIQNLLAVNNVVDIDAAMDILVKYFPMSAGHDDKRFLLKTMFHFDREEDNAPVYPARSL